MKKYIEIEAFYRIEWSKLLRKFYLIQRMSSYEISEKIQADTRIDYSSRAVMLWLKKFGFLRTQAESNRNSILTGRKDFSQRNLDYEGRFIDYDARDRERGYLWAGGLKKLLRQEGGTVRLAKFLGINPALVGAWKNLRHRVSLEYQEKVCSYFGLDVAAIFSEIKTFDIPKLERKISLRNKRRLLNQGYRYAANLKKIIYAKRITIKQLAERLHKPYTSISRWLSGEHLVSPTDQTRIEIILCTWEGEIFTIKR